MGRPFVLDWIQLKEAHSKKPTLSDDRIGIEEVPVCTSAIMSNIPNTTRTEHLQSMIEKHCDNDSVVEFNYEKGQKFAHIRFHNPNGKQTIGFSNICSYIPMSFILAFSPPSSNSINFMSY